MEKHKNKLNLLFRLLSVLISTSFAYQLILMDAYLFIDPSSIGYWILGIKKVLSALTISSGLWISTTKIGQKFHIISLLLILSSLAISYFILPEKGDWIVWIASIFIHGVAIFKLYKNLFKKNRQ